MMNIRRSLESSGHAMTGAEIVLRSLREHGVDVIFGYPGGAVLPLYDALHQQNAIRHVLVRHEQAAVHAAEGYARSTGKVGVVLVTSGPGATNTITGLADAFMDSIPIVCICGQVPTHMIGNDAFQEADMVGISRPCTKHNYLVKSTDDLASVLHEAFALAGGGRPGPIVVDLPKDILLGTGRYIGAKAVDARGYQGPSIPDAQKIDAAVDLLLKAKRPVIVAGGGVINSGDIASRQLRTVIEETGFPFTLTLMGLGTVPADNPRYLGMVGMHGTYEANLAMRHCDVMLAVGVRFDDRVTGRLDGFSPHSSKIQIDIDPTSINKNILVDIGILGDAATVLEHLTTRWQERTPTLAQNTIDAWWAQIAEWRAIDCLSYGPSSSAIKPQYAIERLYALTQDHDLFVTTEVGQHQMWAAQFGRFAAPRRWMTSGGLGTMGYGLPAACGVQIAHPKALVVDISGEASFLMNMQEMATIRQYDLPVKVFLLNNNRLGMVKQLQDVDYDGRQVESSFHTPDFVQLAESYGVVGLRARTTDELEEVILAMLHTPGPVLAEIVVDPYENCFPMIPSGAAHDEMVLGGDMANWVAL